MPHTNTRGRGTAAIALLILLLACVGLAACGGSSSKTPSSTNAASTGASSPGTSSTGPSAAGPGRHGFGRGSARFAAMRECLQKNGITLPTRPPGSRGPIPGASRLGLPKGVTPKQYEAAVKKCGGGRFFGGGARFTNNPAFRAALAKYAACLRQNGVNVPAPNTSGKGPVFDVKGIDTNSPQFKTATTKCRSTLTSAFRRPGDTGGPTPGSGPPGNNGSSN
jgi:hypothetical protein